MQDAVSEWVHGGPLGTGPGVLEGSMSLSGGADHKEKQSGDEGRLWKC